MPTTGHRQVEHEITIEAPAQSVYDLIADVVNWPQIFPPTIYVDHLGSTGAQERIQISATANGKVKTWTSRRILDPGLLRVEFRQEVSAPPVASMGGTWIIEPLDGKRSRVRLLHDYRAVGDDPKALAWIDEAVDRNSRSELGALKSNVERVHSDHDLTFSFTDSVHVNGSSKDLYDFVNAADLWPERLPHVAEVVLEEETPGLQTLEMRTRAKDGSVHTTKSHRICIEHHKIAYKQVTLPALLALHTGYWTFEEGPRGVTASSQHTVVLNTENIARILGENATVADARSYVQGALSANSLATLNYAKAHAEALR